MIGITVFEVVVTAANRSSEMKLRDGDFRNDVLCVFRCTALATGLAAA